MVLLPEPRDLLRAQVYGWYRVRSGELLRRLRGGVAQFTHLAFYQPDAFRSDPRCVRYFAPVLGLSEALRRDLIPEEPDHRRADQLYPYFQLGPVEPLPRPVPSVRGRRILFIPTHWARLATAEEINDLFVGSPVEDRLYRRLREDDMLPEREYHVVFNDPDRPDKPHQFLLDFALFCARADLDLEADGAVHRRPERAARDRKRDRLMEENRWHVLRFTTEQVLDRLAVTAGAVHEAIAEYGGLAEPGAEVAARSEGDTPGEQPNTP